MVSVKGESVTVGKCERNKVLPLTSSTHLMARTILYLQNNRAG